MKKALLFLIGLSYSLTAQTSHDEIISQIKNKGLKELYAFEMLKDLTGSIGHRLSGSMNYEKAVLWSKKMLQGAGADSVWLEPVMIPHWVRGEEKAFLKIGDKKNIELSICALGGSIGTPEKGIQAEVIEVKSLKEAGELKEKAKGKILFFNRPFDRTNMNPFQAYGGAVDQRTYGAIEAAKVGAVAVLIRSITPALDDEPHTGMMRYADSISRIPAAAISTLDAELLSKELQERNVVSVNLSLSCRALPDVLSYNVIGEIRGSENPEEIVLVGGHLDSWDKGTGAHDDGCGIVQSIEVIRLIKSLNVKPKRTIRAVLYANEENGLRGGEAYAARERNKQEKHIAAIESDAGGTTPKGFGVTTDSIKFEKIQSYSSLLDIVGAGKIRKGGGGADISTLEKFGTVLIGLNTDPHRYFDYHHSHNDTIDKVHPRELELGAIAMAILSWIISQNGI